MFIFAIAFEIAETDTEKDTLIIFPGCSKENSSSKCSICDFDMKCSSVIHEFLLLLLNATAYHFDQVNDENELSLCDFYIEFLERLYDGTHDQDLFSAKLIFYEKYGINHLKNSNYCIILAHYFKNAEKCDCAVSSSPKIIQERSIGREIFRHVSILIFIYLLLVTIFSKIL